MNEFENANSQLVSQITRCLPLIEVERQAYIKAEMGRLAAIIGTGYWSRAINDYEIFHGRKGDELALIDDKPHDPYLITIEELYWITEQYKKIERVGTETYTDFFHMLPEDKKRIKLLSMMWHKLTHGVLCEPNELQELAEGHDAFINSKLDTPVIVKGNFVREKPADAGFNGGYFPSNNMV